MLWANFRLLLPPSICQGFDLHWTADSVIYTNIIDHAGEETAGLKHLAGANVEAAVCKFQRPASRANGILGDPGAIHIQVSVSGVPYDCDVVPSAVGNNRIRNQRLRDRPAGPRYQRGHQCSGV